MHFIHNSCFFITTRPTLYPEPPSSLSSEVLQALVLADEARTKSCAIRQELYASIGHTQRLQTEAHQSVNDGLSRKHSQTVTLTVSGQLHFLYN